MFILQHQLNKYETTPFNLTIKNRNVHQTHIFFFSFQYYFKIFLLIFFNIILKWTMVFYGSCLYNLTALYYMNWSGDPHNTSVLVKADNSVLNMLIMTTTLVLTEQISGQECDINVRYIKGFSRLFSNFSRTLLSSRPISRASLPA